MRMKTPGTDKRIETRQVVRRRASIRANPRQKLFLACE